MAQYATPGIYYERADSSGAVIAPLRTDICAFVGIARRGPLNLAIPVDSWRQFVAWFGDFTGAGYLAYAVRGFFENGGRRCWIVRISSPLASSAHIEVEVSPAPLAPGPFPHAWDVEAGSPGVWGNDLAIEWRETHRAQTSANPLQSTPEFATVKSVTGLERGTHVRAFVAPGVAEYRVVSAVNADLRRIYWVNPRPVDRLPYEKPLAAFDPTRPLVVESIEYTLLVRELGRLVSATPGISLSPAHRRYGPALLARFDIPQEGVLSAGTPLGNAAAPNPVAIVERRSALQISQLWPLAPGSLKSRFLADGRDGLASLSTRDFIGEPGSALDDIETRRHKRRGLRALEPVAEAALVAIPDIHIHAVYPPQKRPPPECKIDECLPLPPLPPATPRVPSIGDLPPRFSEEQIFELQQALMEHCTALHDRFAILEPPFETVRDVRLGIAPLREWRRRFDSDMGALYGPWLMVPDPLQLDPSGLRAIPPSGHVAGFMAQTDTRNGVHRAPANGPLSWVQNVTLSIDDALHGVLNPDHVNAIRTFAGRGLRIFGARTLSSDPDWRYVNVRRLMLMIGKAIRIGSQWATFEPNNAVTRSKLHLALTSLLLEVWRKGALAGATAQEAFFVNCAEAQNPPSSRDRGMLIAEVGVAPARPFEFVVVRVAVSDNSLEVTEAGPMSEVA